jgi:hypothetical protein
MLKEGHRHLSGLEEAVLKNIDACRELSAITRTSLGPNGELRSLVPCVSRAGLGWVCGLRSEGGSGARRASAMGMRDCGRPWDRLVG